MDLVSNYVNLKYDISYRRYDTIQLYKLDNVFPCLDTFVRLGLK